MPVELRKRKAPAPAPAPPPARKKTTKAAKVGKAAVAKVKEAAAAVKASPASKPETKKPESKAKAAAAEPAAKPASKAAAKAVAKAPAKASAKASEAKSEAKPEAKSEAKTNGSGAAAPAKASAVPAPVPAPVAAAPEKPVVGDTITLDGFGGEVETSDGKKTTLKTLVDESKAGVVLFTYPKAATPGCTNQACLFRDSYDPLTAGGLAIYGLSTDSVKANNSWKQKHELPYPLLSDTGAALLAAIGLKKAGAKAGSQRGVFVVDKQGKVLLAEPGSPAGTVDAVKKLVSGMAPPEVAAEVEKEDPATATTEDEDGGDDEGKVNGEAAKVAVPAAVEKE